MVKEYIEKENDSTGTTSSITTLDDLGIATWSSTLPSSETKSSIKDEPSTFEAKLNLGPSATVTETELTETA